MNSQLAQSLNQWSDYLAFKQTEQLTVLSQLPHRVIALFAGNRAGKCLTYQTLVETPSGEVSIGELYERGESFDIYSWDGKERVIARAHAPFRKRGLHRCYRVMMADGRWVEAADHHRILLSNGRYASIEDVLCTYSQTQFLSNLDTYQPTRDVDGRHLSETPSGCLDGCFDDYHQYDDILLMAKDTDQVSLPLSNDARQLFCEKLHRDDLAYKHTNIPQPTFSRPSSLDAFHRLLDRFVGFLGSAFCTIVPQLMYEHGTFPLPHFVSPVPFQSGNVTSRHIQRSSISSYSPPLVFNGNRIISYCAIASQPVYDMTVERYHNYFAGGLVHHNTSTVARHYVDRLLGICKIEYKNRLMTKVRCMSSSLPDTDVAAHTDNAQYIELKRLIPSELIVKDITARSGILEVRRPPGLSSKTTIFEFRSSKQELQDLGKINISSLWHDEETPADKRVECQMRLIQEDGDEIFTITTSNPFSYVYDDIFLQSSYIYRTKVVAAQTKEPRVEHLKGNPNIASIVMATDDNPILTPESIDRQFEGVTDPDDIALRRYGVFKQVSGRIHKTYDPKVGYIDFNHYFPSGVPHEWLHCRGIDFHESRTPWSIGWMSISPQNEWFLWQEFHAAIDGPHAYNTLEIVKAMARQSGDYDYRVNLIDPLANKKQSNSGFSVTEDINRYFKSLRETEGLGSRCLWEGWDTKGTNGRSAISMRFKNAAQCGKPFNNEYRENGQVKYYPTLWICNTCPKFHKSIKDWRYGEYVTTGTRAVNDPKGIPMQKNSHDNMVLECLAKDYRVQTASRRISRVSPPQHRPTSVTGR